MISKTTKIICALIFLVHLSISHLLLPALNEYDIYPFYDWNLFSFSPKIQKTFFIRILSVNGVENNPPHILFQHRDLYPGRNYKLVSPQLDRLTLYLLSGPPIDETKVYLYKSELEKNLFHGYKSARYEVNVALIDIRETLKTFDFKNFRTLRTFDYFSEAVNK